VLDVVLPVASIFAVILLGWLAGRLGAFDRRDLEALNRFAYTVAFPALVFTALARSPLGSVADPRAVLAFLAGLAAAVLAGFAASRAFGADATLGGAAVFASGFGNIAYLGFPLVLVVYGPSALGLAAVLAATSILVALPIGMAALLAGDRTPGSVRRTLARNPLFIAALAGAAASVAAGVVGRLPTPFLPLDLLASAASGVALFTLGVFLFHTSPSAFARAPGVTLAAALGKLAVFPAVAFVAGRALGLGGVELGIVALMAALPTGVTVFTVAKAFGRAEEPVAATILVTTLAAALTLPVLLALV